MATTGESLKKHIDGIVTELADYFEVRFSMITRVNPSLDSMHSDLLWMQMDKVRDIMTGEKMFGPERHRVGEIFASRDEPKRAAVMGPLDQSSIMNELIPEQDESDARRPGFVSVRSMKVLYTSVDPSLGHVIELTDIWLWWDILDAADRYNFKRQIELINGLVNAQITPEMRSRYHDAMGLRDEREIKREEILSHEFAYLQSIWKAFARRRAEEESYQRIVRMDPVGGDDSVDDLIVTVSRHITARRKVTGEGGLDDRLRDYYSKVLKCEPDKVTVDSAVSHEDLSILRLREDLRVAMARGEALGEPYDYKMAQSDQMAEEIKRYRAELPLMDSVVQASAAAAARQQPASPQQSQGAPPEPKKTESSLSEPGELSAGDSFFLGG